MTARAEKKDESIVFVWGHLPVTADLVCLPEADALWLASVWDAITGASTWGELQQLAPADAYETISDSWLDSNDDEESANWTEVPADAPFDITMVPNYETGEYPGWMAGWMASTLPASIRSQFGRRVESWASGEGHSLEDCDPAALVAALEALGHTCRHDPELIERAAPGA
jgi:hypothetical protein